MMFLDKYLACDKDEHNKRLVKRKQTQAVIALFQSSPSLWEQAGWEESQRGIKLLFLKSGFKNITKIEFVDWQEVYCQTRS